MQNDDSNKKSKKIKYIIGVIVIIIFIGAMIKSSVSKNDDNVEVSNQNIINNVQTNNMIANNTNEITNKNKIENTANNKEEQLISSNIQETTKSESETHQSSSNSKATTSIQSKTNLDVSKKEDNSRTVYITPTGKRYHYSSTCGGKNSYKTTLSAAKAAGLTPCKKCAK